VHQIDRGVGLEQVAPGALAGVRLAGDQQHAQRCAFLHHRELHHLAAVHQRKARHLQQLDPPVAFFGMAGQQRVHRHGCRPRSAAVEVPSCRRVGDLPIGQQDDARRADPAVHRPVRPGSARCAGVPLSGSVSKRDRAHIHTAPERFQLRSSALSAAARAMASAALDGSGWRFHR
jgi:hypothetical protein